MYSKNLVLICFVASTFLIGCQSRDWSVEDKFYACLQVDFADNGIDLDVSLDSLEAYLIQNKVLLNSSGEGKVDYYRKVAETGEIPSLEPTETMRNLGKFYPGSEFVQNCFQNSRQTDSTQLIHTIYYKTMEKMKADVDKQGALNPTTAAKAILKYYTAADFEHPFYRAHMLLTHIATSERDEAYIRKIPKKIEWQEELGGFTIELQEQDKFLADGRDIPIDELENILFDYIRSFDDDTFIRLRVHPKTNYANFTKIHGIIEESYLRLWKYKALEDYSTRFEKLSIEEQEAIKETYSARIIEQNNF